MHRTWMIGISLFDSGFCETLREFWGEIVIRSADKRAADVLRHRDLVTYDEHSNGRRMAVE